MNGGRATDIQTRTTAAPVPVIPEPVMLTGQIFTTKVSMLPSSSLAAHVEAAMIIGHHAVTPVQDVLLGSPHVPSFAVHMVAKLTAAAPTRSPGN